MSQEVSTLAIQRNIGQDRFLITTVFCLLHDCVEPATFSSEGEGLYALEFVNSFDLWCGKGEFAEFFLCLPEKLLSLYLVTLTGPTLIGQKINNTLVFSDTFILNNLLTRKEIFWRP